MGNITIVGLGPGNINDMTLSALDALKNADVIIGYSYYMHLINELGADSNILKKEVEIIQSGMKEEVKRAHIAIEKADDGNNVAIVSSGDAGIYGMAPLIYEMIKQENKNICVTVVPGISAFQKASSLLGSPTGHDFCVISLSDLMTPWNIIEKRIVNAAKGDFVTAVYNPKSHGRYWQLNRLKEIFLNERDCNTPVGYVKQAGRKDEKITLTQLKDLNPEDIDMFTVILIGNSQSYIYNDKIITPRGYFRKNIDSNKQKIGQNIMIESFKTIESELKNKNIPIEKKWPLLHTIHTTADFDMEENLSIDNNAIKNIYDALITGKTKTIITDVSMVASGIRKGALERLGIEVKCFINDDDVKTLANESGMTRAQIGIRKAVNIYPNAVYAFGNAPTALLELCNLTRNGFAIPSGIIAAPVGFVNVLESKNAVKTLQSVPKIIIEGRKGGSSLAATLINSILCWPDAEFLKPGRDV